LPSIKIVSYNIRRAVDIYGRKDLEQVVKVLKAINADIVALQEVEMVPGIGSQSKQAHTLAKILNMNYAYEPVHRLKFGSVGNAILSRYPILNEVHHTLPDSREERGCLQTEIDIAGTSISFFNMHLGLSQVSRYRHLKYIILPIMQASFIPPILAGDMNATPRMREMRMLTEHLQDTFCHNSGIQEHTYPADCPRVRIDYIFIDDKSTCTGFRIIKAEASDHLPVMATIDIR